MFNIKQLISKTADAIAETLYPTRCVHCDEPDTLLCTACTNKLFVIEPELACPRCGAPFGSFTCTECVIPGSFGQNDELLTSGFPFAAARAAYVYEGVAKSVITTYKDAGEVRLDTIIASGICRAICSGNENWVFSCSAILTLPANPKHVRKRGFDHMKRVTCLCAEWLGLPLIDPLCNVSTSEGLLDQRELTAQDRLKNKLGSYAVKGDFGQLPPVLLLIDDVLTTGASLIAASEVLLSAGACRVLVAVYARVW